MAKSSKLDAYRQKAASVNTIKKTTDDAEKSNSFKNNGGGFKKPHKVELGDNTFRIAPHDVPGESPYVATYQSFLEVMKAEYGEDGEKTGKEVRGKRPVFLASIHGPRDDNGNPLVKKDIIELYIQKVLDYVEEDVQDEKEKKRILGFINGYNDRDGKFNGGIKPSLKYCCYAWDKDWDLSELHLSNKQLDDMTRLSMNENADEAIMIDIFSKVEEAFPLNITKTSKKQKGRNKIEYSISTLGPDAKTRESWEDFWKKWDLTEEKMEELLSEKSLDEKFVEVYTMKDFNMAMDGLAYVDSKIGANILANDDLLDQFEKIAELIPAEPENNSSDTNNDEKEDSAPAVKKTSAKKESGDVSPLKMKRAISAYVEENYPDQEIPTLPKPKLKEWYNLVIEGEELPFPDNTVDNTEKEEENETATESSEQDVPEAEVKSRVSSLRDRRKK